jgi:leucine dehydrogenase
MNRICQRDAVVTRWADLRLFRDARRGVARCGAAVSAGGRPGLGGTREGRWGSDAALLEDLLRLTDGMRLKSAFHGLPFTGGKVCVELAPDADPERAYEAVGELVAQFGGALLTAEDVSTSPAKMAMMARTGAPYVLGLPATAGGSGDPSPLTARGVVGSIRAWGRLLAGAGRLAGLKVFVKGVGHVGAEVVRLLLAEGALVGIADRDARRLGPWRDQPGVQVVTSPDQLRDVDVFCPCAHGGDVGFDFDLPVRAVVGAANNQLTCDEVADALHGRGTVYVPDWVANGGGLMSVTAEYLGHPRAWALERAQAIGPRVEELLAEARQRRLPPLRVAYDACARNEERGARPRPCSGAGRRRVPVTDPGEAP